MGAIDDRKIYSLERIQELNKLLVRAQEISAGKACVFASGSFGRLEASAHSDLDPCIVSLCDRGKRSKLSLLSEIALKAEIISAVKEFRLPEIDGDGKYLGQFTSYRLVKEIGSPVDDSDNTFSTRLLMLLEGRPILNSKIFYDVMKSIIEAYWVDFDRYQKNFIPAYFTNDILRLWRTFCINYEARTRKLVGDLRIKKKVKNYKLKHSRILTCYSAIIYLLAVYKLNGTVTPSDAFSMCSMTPIERLESVKNNGDLQKSHYIISKLIDMYEKFLDTTNQDGPLLEKQIQDNEGYMREDYRFGQEMFNAIGTIGDGGKFHRLIVV
ncbi:hypothetical protein [Mesorhizobium sp.]|uniref:hypothetical protein n=1 Tax=Mesorhizobium sp. TaxID=1871066 RepID=UPI000FE5F1AD|nr:hypothetical protein [Mesorhizobium sp.]RWK62854.1 MAG: hypothetical protein EOR49_11895 [Mesorhizobium sp.]RWM49732.1 MAG: hypothetical protein EOR76_09350 [Mesorhizobium sp.]RWM55108.1 MAG: hypothetical protein EOR79_21635 [Mesorhizobium sp.]RWM56130.1 MAG: hypothetical protein EOR78_13155 [Mesorhizobium sp.]RWN01884.1 MAG: hypothetical protein EOR85_14435 [Mesorhizobium sp.]